MAIDYERYLNEIHSTSALIQAALPDLQAPIMNDGFIVPPFLYDEQRYNPQYSQYASGKIFFQRVFDELRKALALLNELDPTILSSDGVQAQRAFDEVSYRQRKLFETMLVTMMFSREEIYAPLGAGAHAQPNPGLYFLNYHLTQERDYLQYKNKDLVRYFGGTCSITEEEDEQRQLLIEELAASHNIDRRLCTWNRDTRGQFENVFAMASPLERTALGFGYQEIFGAASNQVHLNMCIFYHPRPKEREFLKRVDNLLLIVVSIVLRIIRIVELAFGQVAASGIALRNEFSGAFPDTYVGAALGVADPHDIVAVLEGPDFFLAEVESKTGGSGSISEGRAQTAVNAERAFKAAAQKAARTPGDIATEAAAEANRKAAESTAAAARAAAATAATASPAAESAAIAAATLEAQAAEATAKQALADAAAYVAYTAQPLGNVGRRGSFTDVETIVIVRRNHLAAVLQEAVDAGMISADTVTHGELFALTQIINSPDGMQRIIMPRANATNMPGLYFVQKYLQRGA